MNRVTRNVAVVLGAILSSLFTAAALLFLEARTGQQVFFYTVASYIPAGAIAGGLIAAAGLLACAFALRARPAPVVGIALCLVSAGTIYVAQSASASLDSAGRVAAEQPASFLQYLVNATVNSQVQLTDANRHHELEASAQLNPNAGKAIAQSGAPDDAQVESISSGVQGVVSSQDMGTNVAAGGAQRIAQIGDQVHDLGSNVQNHGGQWITLVLQIAGFSIGSLVAYSLLRARPHCEQCGVLLSRKGAQTRYFGRLDEINGSLEQVLAKAKERRLQLAVQAHGASGAPRKGKATQFASTIRVLLCMRCQTHRMDFRAMRKSGGGWKEIPVLGYTASSYEPIEVAG